MLVASLAPLALALVGGTGCAAPDPGYKLTWRTISRGVISGIETPMREVIRTEAEYLRLWATHAAPLQRTALPPRVDFSREMVVVTALGTRPTGGYFVDIVDLELSRNTLRVLVSEREPRPGMLQVQQLTQPYQMVALPVVNARVEFKSVREQVHTPSSRDTRNDSRLRKPRRAAAMPSTEPALRSPRDATSR